MHKLRVVTYNIHKGVRGIGPVRRLEIHNIRRALELLDADVVCLQEVRHFHKGDAKRLAGWPSESQAAFLTPENYASVYCTNAVTRSGEHGNALISRWPVVCHQHVDMSDHRFEQRGLLHCIVSIGDMPVHVIVVHLGLIPASRRRQLAQLVKHISIHVPDAARLIVAGDFNESISLVSGALAKAGLISWALSAAPTFPSSLPLVQFDHILVRGLSPVHLSVPQGGHWTRMSDHLPVIMEFDLQPPSKDPS